MVDIRITRWSPDTCGCIFEQEYDADSPQSEPKFLLVNTVCERHAHLISKKRKTDHSAMSRHALDLVEMAKSRNIEGSLKHMARFKDGSNHKLQAAVAHQSILRFNDEISDEWNNLVSQTYAHDSHIFELVLNENRAKNNNLVAQSQASKNNNIING